MGSEVDGKMLMSTNIFTLSCKSEVGEEISVKVCSSAAIPSSVNCSFVLNIMKARWS